MEPDFSQKLNTKLFVFPVAVLLVLFVAGGIAFYFFSPLFLLQSSFKTQLATLSSEKKLLVDTWLEQNRKHIEYLSKDPSLRDDILILGSAPADSGRANKKMIGLISREVQLKTSKLLDDIAFSSQCRMAAVLSKDGKVIASSQSDQIGEDWSGRALIKSMASEAKPAPAVGFYDNGGGDNGIVFLTPIFDTGDNMTAMLYSVASVEKLSRLLKIEGGSYTTEKMELIGREGNLILTKNGIPDKRLKYNIPNDTKEPAVRLKDSMFFYVLNLDQAPFRLIGTVEEAEVMRPLDTLRVLFFSFAGLMLLLLVVQSAYRAPNLISRPASRLSHAIRSMASGDLDADLGEGYSGEMLQLKSALASLVDELKAKETALNGKLSSEAMEPKTALCGSIAGAVKGPLHDIIEDAESVLGNKACTLESSVTALSGIVNSAKGLSVLVDDLLDLSALEEGKLAIVTGEFNMCELFREIEDEAKDLVGTKPVTLIVDCHEAFMDKPVSGDRARFKQIMTNLIRHAVMSTDMGTVTVLASEALREGVEYIEVSVADTGSDMGYESPESIFEDYLSSPEALGLSLSKRLTETLGGSMALESGAGKGAVFTVEIPVKAVLY